MSASAPWPDLGLRRAVLAFALREPGPLAELVVTDRGVDLPGGPHVGWEELTTGAGTGEQVDVTRRVARWLRLRARLHALIQVAGPDVILAHTRPYALPREHPLCAGPAWQVGEVLGGAIAYGLGLRHVDDDGREHTDRVGLLPIGVVRAAGVEEGPLLATCRAYLEEMAELGAGRLLRTTAGTLRPVGDCDVVTLLTSPTYRKALVRDAVGVVGLRSAAVPDRRRGWLDLGRIDPAFALAAASLTDAEHRAFCRPLLVTLDEVVQVREGGDVLRDALHDPVAPDPVQPIHRLY